MLTILDPFRSRGNARDDEAVKAELHAEDAKLAEPAMVRAAMKSAELDEPAARELIAESEGYRREIDIAESDADADDAPERWQRADVTSGSWIVGAELADNSLEADTPDVQ